MDSVETEKRINASTLYKKSFNKWIQVVSAASERY